MFRIGICDDEIRARDGLRLSLEKILHNDEERIFYEFSSGEGAASWMEKHPGELDLLFLDVEMGGISGMEAARRIREHDRTMFIVFVTGYADFVFDGYAVQAMDYIIKPAKAEKLAEVLTRAKVQMEERRPKTFTVQNADGLYRVAKEDILYFYSDKRLVNLVTHKREYSFYHKLDDVEKQLDSDFIRIHQRYLVRAEAVQKLEGSTVTVGGAVLPVSRALRQKAAMKLAQSILKEKDQI